jgi:pimeloyl-ACP methyl ester carboxylesterase
MVSMLRFTAFRALLLLAPLAAACGSDDMTDTPTAPTPVAVTETFGDAASPLTPFGGRTHPFVVQQAGTISARLSALEAGEAVVVGLSLGTWNGQVCQIVLRNDAALLNATITGTAQQTGQFCVSIYDVGNLTAPTTYTIEVTHF